MLVFVRDLKKSVHDIKKLLSKNNHVFALFKKCSIFSKVQKLQEMFTIFEKMFMDL